MWMNALVTPVSMVQLVLMVLTHSGATAPAAIWEIIVKLVRNEHGYEFGYYCMRSYRKKKKSRILNTYHLLAPDLSAFHGHPPPPPNRQTWLLHKIISDVLTTISGIWNYSNWHYSLDVKLAPGIFHILKNEDNHDKIAKSIFMTFIGIKTKR